VNPFNASTTLHYDLPEPSKVRVIIYDILGRKVIELVNDYQNYGYKKIIWNGMNESGEMVPPGIYFYKAELGTLTETKKMVLLK
jgi:flagellar hook assembly protein FlgD